MKFTKNLRIAAVVAASALALAACGGGGASTETTGATTGAASGDTVTIWTSVDQPVMDGLKAGLEPLAAAEGITVEWQKVDAIDQLIITKAQVGDLPDIAIVPQPGVVQKLVDLGVATALDDVVDMDNLASITVPGVIEAGVMADGNFYGLLTSMNVKGLVFYPKPAWDAAGYEAPQTLDELLTLTADMAAAGQTPWCNGIESGGATGWPATDWMENLVMRQAGPDAYNSWVKGDIKFDSPEFRDAAAYFESIFFNDAYVNGGRAAIPALNFGDAIKGLFTDPTTPDCMMYSQGSFITGSNFVGEDIAADLDNQVGVFILPGTTAGEAPPVEGGGDLSVLLSDNPDAATVMNLFTNPEMGVPATAVPGSSYMSPFKTFDVANYQGALNQQVAGIAYNASYFLFDGSDAMPAEVGAGTFWTEMTAWISGEITLDDAVANIDASWPAG